MYESEKHLKDKGEFCLQTFTPIQQMSSVLVSEQLLKVIPSKNVNGSNARLVQKYLPINRFIDSILRKYFYLAAPQTWDDPFELKYLEALDNPDQYGLPSNDFTDLKDMSIFCSCMTYNDSDNEEASWKSYDTDREQVIRVSYDFDKLCSILNKERIYVGKVIYEPRIDILKPKKVILHIEGAKNVNNEILYVNNFCFKQDAYKYEKELRFCKICKDKQFKDEKGYKITGVDLTPAVILITLPPINYKWLKEEEKELKKMDQIKKFLLLHALCPSASICVSNLYDSSKNTMTSEINIKTIEEL